eukprot:12348764-Heterocapsa_arctica.AAC.1
MTSTGFATTSAKRNYEVAPRASHASDLFCSHTSRTAVRLGGLVRQSAGRRRAARAGAYGCWSRPNATR